MVLNMAYAWELIKAGLISFRDTNFDLVRFNSSGLALGAGLFVAVVLLYKLLWGRIKFSQLMSGHHIPQKYNENAKILKRTILLIPKIFLAGAVFFMLVSLANPYLPKTTIEEIIESRERIDLIDVSSSKGWEFENTGKSAGQLGREAFLKFLDMRRGQNDRVSLWLFANEPHLIEDFIVDDDIYRMQVEDAPYVIVDPYNPGFPENDPDNSHVYIIAPRDKIQLIYAEGGTKLNPALDEVIKYFDKEGNKRIKRKALLIETDAAVEDDAEKQLRELQKRNIKVYLLHIKPNELGESKFGTVGVSNAKLLKDRVRQFGGKVFDIQDKKSIENAYREIDRLEKAPIKITRHLFRVFIYQRPLIVSITLMLLAVAVGSLTDVFGENP